MEFRLLDALYEGVCVIRMEGYFCLGAASRGFQSLIDRRLQEGIRLFVVDLRDIRYLDSSGIASLAYGQWRLKMRPCELNIIYSETGRVKDLFELTKLRTVFESCSTPEEAISKILNRPMDAVGNITNWEPLLSIEKKDKAYVVRDAAKLLGDNPQSFLAPNERLEEQSDDKKNSAPEITSEVKTRPTGERTSSKTDLPAKVSPLALASMVLFALAALGGILGALVWTAKQISSTVVLTLIFSVSLLFYLNVVAFVLVVSGYIGEKTASSLLNGVLGKVPGLKLWVPRVMASRKS